MGLNLIDLNLILILGLTSHLTYMVVLKYVHNVMNVYDAMLSVQVNGRLQSYHLGTEVRTMFYEMHFLTNHTEYLYS